MKTSFIVLWFSTWLLVYAVTGLIYSMVMPLPPYMALQFGMRLAVPPSLFATYFFVRTLRSQ